MNRRSQNKGKSSGSFKSRSGKTHKMNLSNPLRGGWRL